METTISRKMAMITDAKNRIQEQFNRVFYGITRVCEQKEMSIVINYKDAAYGIQYLPNIGYEFVCFNDNKPIQIKEMPMHEILNTSRNLEQIYRTFVNTLARAAS